MTTTISHSAISSAIDAYRSAGERGDADAVAPLLAPDVPLHSPLTERVRFEGREEVTGDAPRHLQRLPGPDDRRAARARRTSEPSASEPA